MVTAAGHPLLHLGGSVEAQPQHRNARLVKEAQQRRAQGDRLLQAGRLVEALPARPVQPGSLQHHRGIDPHPLGSQGNQPPGGFHRPLGAVPPQAGHHLEPQREPALPDGPGGRLHLGGGVAPAVAAEDLVVHALGAQLDGSHPIKA